MTTKLTVRAESLPERCEVCHLSDCFDPKRNYCTRCAGINIPSSPLALYLPRRRRHGQGRSRPADIQEPVHRTEAVFIPREISHLLLRGIRWMIMGALFGVAIAFESKDMGTSAATKAIVGVIAGSFIGALYGAVFGISTLPANNRHSRKVDGVGEIGAHPAHAQDLIGPQPQYNPEWAVGYDPIDARLRQTRICSRVRHQLHSGRR